MGDPEFPSSGADVGTHIQRPSFLHAWALTPLMPGARHSFPNGTGATATNRRLLFESSGFHACGSPHRKCERAVLPLQTLQPPSSLVRFGLRWEDGHYPLELYKALFMLPLSSPPHPELPWRPRSTASLTRSRTPFWTSLVLTRRLLWVGSPMEEIIRRYHQRRHSRFVNSNLVLFVVDIYPSSRRWLDDPERRVWEVSRCQAGRNKERRQAHWDPHPTGLGHSPRWSRCLAVSHVPQAPQRLRLLTTES